VCGDYGIIITDLVMTFVKLSTTDEYPVRPYTEGIDNKQRVHSSGTHNPDRPDIWRVLKTSHACSIGCRIAAPVAEKTEYLWFKFVICHFAHSGRCHLSFGYWILDTRFWILVARFPISSFLLFQNVELKALLLLLSALSFELSFSQRATSNQ